ncbi:hypothetical protein BDFB_010507, partial [Asbolus verrucosus]
IISLENKIIILIDPYFQEQKTLLSKRRDLPGAAPAEEADGLLSKQIDAVGTVTYIIHAGSGTVSRVSTLPIG